MRRLRELPLVSQLTIVTLMLGAVTALAGAWWLRDSAREAIREQEQARNVAIAQRLATGLDDRLDADTELLQLLATNDKITGSKDSAQTELFVALRSRALPHLILFDENGAAVASAADDQLVQPGEEGARPDLIQRLRTESRVIEVLSGGVPTVEVSVAVEDPPGVVAGGLTLRTPLEDVARRLDARLLEPDVVAFLVGAGGRVLVHPERDRVIRGETYDLDGLLADDTRTASRERDGEPVLAAIAEISSFEGAVVVEEPEATAFEAAGETASQLTLILLLAVLAIVLGVSMIGRSLLAPLRPLQRAVDALGRGELTDRVPETGGREVRALATDFNQMADALQTQIDELEISEKRLHAILDNTRAIVYLKEPEGRYLFVNRQFEKRFGKRREEMLGKTDHDIFPHHIAAVFRANDVAVIESGTMMEREELADVRGEKRTYISVKFPLLDSAGDTYGVCGISTDITEHKKVADYQQQLEDARRRRMQALEINDKVIQGLAVALYSLDLRRPAEAQKALEDTLAAARSIINDLLHDDPEEWGPGDFIRAETSRVEHDFHPDPLMKEPPSSG